MLTHPSPLTDRSRHTRARPPSTPIPPPSYHRCRIPCVCLPPLLPLSFRIGSDHLSYLFVFVSVAHERAHAYGHRAAVTISNIDNHTRYVSMWKITLAIAPHQASNATRARATLSMMCIVKPSIIHSMANRGKGDVCFPKILIEKRFWVDCFWFGRDTETVRGVDALFGCFNANCH